MHTDHVHLHTTLSTEHVHFHTTLSIHNAHRTCPFPHNAQKCTLNMSISTHWTYSSSHSTQHSQCTLNMTLHTTLSSQCTQRSAFTMTLPTMTMPNEWKFILWPHPTPNKTEKNNLIKNNHKKYKTIKSTRVYNFTLSLIHTKLTSNSGSNHPYPSKTKNKTKQKTPTCPPKK